MKPREAAAKPGEAGDAAAPRPTPGLRLDALPPGMAGPVLNSLIRSAACAASREMAHALFAEKAG